jgi:hypothetical protein
MAGFADMKKMSKNSVGNLQKELEKTSESKSYKDDRFWTTERGKDGNGFAIVRFLPSCEGEDVPWVRLFNHGFQGKGGWYIENCPTTLGLKCPVCEANNELWNSGIESDKEIARARKRKLSYISNIMVISDPANRENEGKVFLFRYGKKIFDKISDCMQPKFPGEQPTNPFDFWNGRNFKMKIQTVGGFANYDKSEFDTQSALLDGKDELLEKVWKSQYPLSELVGKDKFKAYEELKERFDTVINTEAKPSKKAEDEEPIRESLSEKFRKNEAKVAAAKKPVPTNDDEDGEGDTLDYFRKLAEED